MFDPTRALRVDLAGGAVVAGEERERVVLVPVAALDELVLGASRESIDALGRAIGAGIGRRAAARMKDADAASIEEFVTQLAGEAAVAGVGALSVERWGRALVVVVEGSPLGDALLVPVVASAIEATSKRKVACAAIARDPRAARILVASESAVQRVREWIASGVAWGDAIARLHGGAS